MAPAHPRFVHHPGVKEAPASSFVYQPESDKNPALRGWPLVIASNLVAYRQWITRILWYNAKADRPALLPGLDKVVYRLDPTVIPIADGTAQLGISADLSVPQPADLIGRFNSVADYHAAYKAGTITPLQVVDALLPLIRRDIASASKYSVAWTHCHPDEVRATAKASTERWQAGKQLGILDGVPIGVKDDIDVEGYVSSMGMKVNKSEPFFTTPAKETWWPVVKLREAGAIMVGKMNQHEIGMDVSGCNPSTGTPRNWYNSLYYPGGSSSGAGSALGAGLVPICLGTDAGGSIRIPCAWAGVYSLKTSHNRTMVVNSSMCIVGPMAPTVKDLTIAYRTISQPDPEDPVCSKFGPSIAPAATAKKYIGICQEWVRTSDPDVLAAFKAAVNYLTTKCDYEAIDIQLPYLEEIQWMHAAATLSESADHAKTRTRDPRRWLSLVNHANRILLALGAVTPATDFLKYGQVRQVVMQHLAHLFEKYPGLLILTPTTPQAGWPVNPGDQAYGFTDANITLKMMRFVILANLSGCPATTCPVAYVDPKQGEGKIPVGLMAMGEWGAEEQLLGFAGEAEKYLHETYPGGRLRPKEWVDVISLAKEVKVDGEGK